MKLIKVSEGYLEYVIRKVMIKHDLSGLAPVSRDIIKLLREEGDHVDTESTLTDDFDEHLGCHNWPNCDEYGCGYRKD